ncbi:unnamed protein product [Polarella glacialis]|uniref:Peptidylamidoglycolate lyase n=1 Tax=Polarella glacialis TaxID=89957 RepID=A0A813GH83_POLGL|nr:unnamed protein product [Polarella glacialis]
MAMAKCSLLQVFVVFTICAVGVSGQAWSLYAGSPTGELGTASQHRFNFPVPIAVHPKNGKVYVGNIGVDGSENLVNDVRVVSKHRSVSLLNVPGLTITEGTDIDDDSSPQGLAVSTHALYVSDTASDHVLQHSVGPWSTLTPVLKRPGSGGGPSSRRGPDACGLAVSHKTGLLYVADWRRKVWKQGPHGALGVLVELPDTATPYDVALDHLDNVYIADYAGTVWKYDGPKLSTIGDKNTLFNDGSKGFARPTGVAVCRHTGEVFVLDATNNAVRLYNPKRQVWSTIGGTTCRGTGFCVAGMSNEGLGSFNFTTFGGLAVDSHCNLFVADSGNHQIRKWCKRSDKKKRLRAPAAANIELDASSLLQQMASPQMAKSDVTQKEQEL